MSPLLTAHSLTKAYGTVALFQDISFSLCPGDRIGMIGPNGSGKTSLMKILAGVENPDSGYISKKQNLRIGYASQAPEFPSLPIEKFLTQQIPDLDEAAARTKARILLGKAEFSDYAQDAALLSGGWKKRLDIVKALIDEPDLLLLDEPTNHLDLEGIVWLEAFLKKLTTPYVVISHDRYFLENVINKVMEINKCYPEGLLQCQGNMSAYARQKEAFLGALEKKRQELAFKVREEVDWLRTSPKARTSKSQSRIQQAYKLIDELADVKQRKAVHKVSLEFSASDRETRKLLTAKNISKSLAGKELFKHLDLTLSPGTRLGIVGKNGTGKTTLLKVLAGTIPQDMGVLKYASDLNIIYFDQYRDQIPLDTTLKDALSPNSDFVSYRGQQIHVNGWGKKFLFNPDRLNLPIGCLSGGERARILIAKLMLEPADILFLDEPTNDLDISTLEVMEESLTTFSGAVVLISHDRCLMDNLCTKILVLGEGSEPKSFADYKQWKESCILAEKKEKADKKASSVSKKEAPLKLSYKEKKELENMEQLIAETEALVEHLHKELEDKGHTQEAYKALADAQESLESHYHRWQYLLNKSSS